MNRAEKRKEISAPTIANTALVACPEEAIGRINKDPRAAAKDYF